MNISGGISEINFPGRADGARPAEKVFIWPVYNSGRVGRINETPGRTEETFVYTRLSLGEREKLYNLSKENSEPVYTSSGRLINRSEPAAGSLFHAIV
jgi:hypothetical protein